MFKELKNKESMEIILSKLIQIDSKLSSIDKLIREKQKSVRDTENKAK